jgi:hypothetical protein
MNGAQPYWKPASEEIPRNFMKHEDSLQRLQEPYTCPCPKPAQSSPCHPNRLLKGTS